MRDFARTPLVECPLIADGKLRGKRNGGHITMPDWEDKVNNAASRAENEVRRLIDYLNDEVVPDVRRQGSVALRTAAERLHELARNLDDSRKPDDGGTPRT